MHPSQRASPSIERCCWCIQIILKKPRVTVCAGEKPNVLIAALPCCSGKKCRHRCSSAWACQQAIKEISSRTEEPNQPFADWPGIVTGATIERRRRKLSAAARPRKKDIDLSAADFQPSAQIARPWILVWDSQRLPRTPLS